MQQLLDRYDPLQDAVFALFRGDSAKRYQMWIAAYDTVADADLVALRARQASDSQLPNLSLIVPLAHSCEAMLAGLAESLLAQVYERWEVAFVPAPSLDDGVLNFVVQAPSRDARFRPVTTFGQSVEKAWNQALGSAASEFVVLVESSVLLRPHALSLLAEMIERHGSASLIYADEDAIDEKGARSAHYFKPDWNEALLRCQNYLGGLVAFRRSLAVEVGGCDEELDGDCAWGLFLRITTAAASGTVHHLPFVLSHRIASADGHGLNPELRERVARAAEDRLARLGEGGRVEPVGEKSYRTRYEPPDSRPHVSVIVPSTGKLDVLRPCLDGLLNRTSYSELDVLLVTNAIREKTPEQREYLGAVGAQQQVQVLQYEESPFNFSRVNNWAANQAGGDLLCFLNDDTEVIEGDWLAALVARVVRPRVAIVGAMLLYPNERIQHAGVLLGAGGVAAHMYSRRPRGIGGYHDRALVDQDVSCVTAACMLVRRDVFLDIGGFDEALAIAFNDVDFCLRVREAGWRIVWTPTAELYHKESASIGRHDADERGEEWASAYNLMRNRWGKELATDPQYNPNLSLDPLQLWEPGFPPRRPEFSVAAVPRIESISPGRDSVS